MNAGNEMWSSNEAKSRNLPRLFLLVLMVLLALGLASRFAITIHAGWTAPPRPGSDASEYDSFAWNLAQGRGYSGISPDVNGPDGQPLVHPTAYRSPGTSVYGQVCICPSDIDTALC